ncbi:MAG: xanthine dehydrogenase family protein subunit M, partial [Candidatus Aminicenantes bacterium]|nr:xanthine dehydrogenase family protein subunit M [Candidatus Aminicenantes bacterium]NIT26850.1 xanthine dehydrogenase family protein subunit M [Candidatus Aminicenantes bacterium]
VDAKIVLSAVGPRPVTSAEAENELKGTSLSKENLARAAEAIIARSDPPSDIRGSAEFKKIMLQKLFFKTA